MAKNDYLLKGLLVGLLAFTIGKHVHAQPNVMPPHLIETFVKYIEEHAMPITDYLLNTKELSTFVKTLKLSDQFEVLNSQNQYTIFAPTNQAFEQFPTDVIKELFSASNKEKLKSITSYHIVKGKFRTSDIINEIKSNRGKALLGTLNGLDLAAYADENGLFIKDDNGYSIKIIEQDILQSNGVVYKIDTVILPRVDDHLPRN